MQPFIALGQGLRAAGHDVALCTSVSYQPAIEEYGLEYAFMSDTLLTLTRAILTGSMGPLAITRQMNAAIRGTITDEWDAAQAFQPDLIVNHPKMLGSYHIG